MTRKDYELLAFNIRAALEAIGPESAPNTVLRAFAATLADDLRRDNPRFDRARFLTACGFHE